MNRDKLNRTRAAPKSVKLGCHDTKQINVIQEESF